MISVLWVTATLAACNTGPVEFGVDGHSDATSEDSTQSDSRHQIDNIEDVASDESDALDEVPLAECPTAIIDATEGDEVLPQTRLHLVGSQSLPGRAGEIAGFTWTVDQPAGSTSAFSPSAYVADPTFEANVAGVYKFSLHVFDAHGVESCEPAEYVVNVASPSALHIELLWTTPGDPDSTDGLGADLDLHFLHPNATGFFDEAWDTYWNYPQPHWALNGAALPSLDRDDTDGDGPENLNFDSPEDGLRYCVGVHYWDDRDFGVSYATLRIYVYGALAFEIQDVALAEDDLWQVTCFTWPTSAQSIASQRDDAGGLLITHDYRNPLENP